MGETGRVRRRRGPLVAGVAALAAAVLIGLAVAGRPAGGLDESWMRVMLALRGPAGEAVARAFNFLGGGWFGVFAAPIGIALALVVARRPWAGLFSITAAALSAGAVQLLKHAFGRVRPDDILVHADLGSFPSGHTANAATIAATFALLFPRVWVISVGAGYTLLMALSRTYLGAHWLTDTLGGALVGAGVALVVWAPFAHALDREAARAAGPPPR